MNNVGAIPPPIQIISPEEPLEQKLSVLDVITQIAVRALFIFMSILIAAAAFPVGWHQIVLPIVAMGTTTLAAFFYSEPKVASAPLSLPEPLVRDIEMEDELSVDLESCALSAMAYYFDPEIAGWMLRPLHTEVDMEMLRAFLSEYNLPENLLTEFDAYLEKIPAPRPHIPFLFVEFLQERGDPSAKTFQNLWRLQGPFSAFFGTPDEEGQVVFTGNEEDLLIALREKGPHLIDLFLSLLPDRLKTKIETTYYYNMNKAPETKRKTIGAFQLIFANNQSFESVFRKYCNNTNQEPPISQTTVDLLEAPSALRFHINRSTDAPIEFPEEIPVTLKSGEVCRYRLGSFMGYKEGVYSAARIENGNKYLMEQGEITLADPELWNQLLGQAYHLCYLPV